MIAVIEGVANSTARISTSLVLASILKTERDNGREILSNMNLTFKHKKLDLIDGVFNEKGKVILVSSTIGLDHYNYCLDSRRPDSRINKLFSHQVSSSKDLRIFIALAGSIKHIDRRLQKLLSLRLRCSPIVNRQIEVTGYSKDSEKVLYRYYNVDELTTLCSIKVPTIETENVEGLKELDNYLLQELGFKVLAQKTEG